MVVAAGVVFFRETALFGFSLAVAFRMEPPERLARGAALAALCVSSVDAADALPLAIATLDFFKFFAIYFSFSSAKPLRAERARASGNGTKTALR